MKPTSAMIFAAGYGSRMGALIKDKPKPLINVKGRPLIDYALDITAAAGVTNCVVNLHYKADQLAAHLNGVAGVKLSYEAPAPLETGGGLKHALHLLGKDPVFTLNPDVIWTGPNPLNTLAENWRSQDMEALLLLIPREQATGYQGRGDYIINHAGQLIRDCTGEGPYYVFGGAHLVNASGLATYPRDIFSLVEYWDELAKQGKLFGCVHQGHWTDVGTPQGIIAAEKLLDRTANV